MDVHRECVDLFSSHEIKLASSLTPSVLALKGVSLLGDLGSASDVGMITWDVTEMDEPNAMVSKKYD